MEQYGLTLNHDLGGLLGESGFLEALYLADSSSKLDLQSNGCNSIAWYMSPSPLCRCILSRVEQSVNCKALEFPQELRKQACCEWWLGKTLQGKGKLSST